VTKINQRVHASLTCNIYNPPHLGDCDIFLKRIQGQQQGLIRRATPFGDEANASCLAESLQQ